MILGGHVTYEYMLVISLHRVVWRVRVMSLHSGVMNGEVDMVDRARGCFCDISAMTRCPGDLKGHTCVDMCLDVFGL